MDQQIQVLQLINWFNENKRNLVFRQDKNPYHIWISEVMAQQTQIVTMTPYYLKWMSQYPTIQSVAKSNLEDLYVLWQGLGYYSRCKNIYYAAKQIMEEYNGQMPTSYQQLLAIQGIGPYIAGAISAICYDEKVAVIDGNVNRVVSRFNQIHAIYLTADFKKAVLTQVNDWLNFARPGLLAEGLMELGALVCTPKNTKCNQCPLNKWCKGQNDYFNYPNKVKKKSNPIQYYEASVIICDHKIAIAKPPYDDSLMQGLYRLPQVKVDYIQSNTIKHVYSHLTWMIHANIVYSQVMDDHYLWVDLNQLSLNTPLIGAHYKVLQHLKVIYQ